MSALPPKADIQRRPSETDFLGLPDVPKLASGPTTASGVNLLGYPTALEIPMTVSMVDRPADKKEASPWPADIAADFERESENPNPCVGTTLLSENERTRVWIIRLAPGERLGFHRHVLDYFGPRFPAAAGARMYRMARRSNTPTSPTRHGTGASARANSQFTIWKISAIARWSSRPSSSRIVPISRWRCRPRADKPFLSPLRRLPRLLCW